MIVFLSVQHQEYEPTPSPWVMLLRVHYSSTIGGSWLDQCKKIRKISEDWPWKHVTTDLNPADDASQGLSVHDTDKVKR